MVRGPSTQTDEQRGIQAEARVAERTIERTLPIVKIELPRVPDADLQAMLRAAQDNDRRGFDATLRAAAPRADTDQTYNRFRELIGLFGEVTTHAADFVTFRWARNMPEADREGQMLAELGRRGTAMGIVGMNAIVLTEMREQTVARGRELGKSPEEIRTQEEDLARAAISYGFGVSDVLNVFGDFAAQGTNAMSRQRSDTFRQVLGEAASKRTEELMRRMREMQDEMGGAEGVRRRQLQEEYNIMLSEYGRLTGHTLASEVADRWVRGGEAPQAEQGGRQVTLTIDDMKSSARTETEHLFDLHNHNLGNVVPVPTERRVA
jgi:hypothetical protein